MSITSIPSCLLSFSFVIVFNVSARDENSESQPVLLSAIDAWIGFEGSYAAVEAVPGLEDDGCSEAGCSCCSRSRARASSLTISDSVLGGSDEAAS